MIKRSKPRPSTHVIVMNVSSAETDKIHLRRATGGDAAAVASCVLAAYSSWVERIGMQPGPMLENYADVLDTADLVVVAELECAIVGVLVTRATGEGFLLENVAVHPRFAGRGLGKRLVERAEREAVARGHRSIYLYTHERMVGNIAMYGRLGYVEYARRLEGPFSRVFMRKALLADHAAGQTGVGR
jgi:ribosomal protein S18 acetylase RimI-like enzyme